MRLLKNEGLKIRKISNILMTRVDWKSTGGLVSLTLELGNIFHTPLCLHSPVDWDFKNSTKLNRSFIDLACKHVTQFDYENKRHFEDKNIIVKLLNFNIDTSNLSRDQLTNSYEVTMKKCAPKFLNEKIAEKDIKPGPWIRELKEGRSVTLDGVLYNPDEFLDHSNSIQSKLLVLDLPNKSCIHQLDTLIDRTDRKMQVIVHMSDREILHDQNYMAWIKSFTTECVHLYFDEEFPGLTMDKIYELQTQLNLVNEKLFPLLHGQIKEEQMVKEKHLERTRSIMKHVKLIQSEPNMIMTLRPDFGLDLEKVIRPNNDTYRNKILEHYDENLRIKADGGPDEALKRNLDDLRLKISEINDNDCRNQGLVNESPLFPKILFLGTASSQATSQRNVTSILVKMNKDSSMLLDCGEGTLNQLYKFFGKERTQTELTKIKVLFLTHIHLDHQHGTFGLILDRIEAFKHLNIPYEKLRIMVPKFYVEQCLFGIENLLKKNIFEYVEFLPNELFLTRNFQPRVFVKRINIPHKYLVDEFSLVDQKRVLKEVKSVLGLVDFATIAVHHIGYSYAIVLYIKRENYEKPFKLVFSGDCRPNNCLINQGKECDLLIHECTFDSKRQADALRKNHCTIHEAVTVAQSMNAKQTVLTHFSARYGVLGHVDDINAKNIGFSFDFMYLNSGNLRYVNEITELLKILFPRAMDRNAIRNKKLTFHTKAS